MSARFGFGWRDVAFVASAAAAAIHFAAAPPHLREYAPAGAFMLMTGCLQWGWAIWITRRPSLFAMASGMAGNACLVWLWIVSRTMGLPIGMNPRVPEHIHSTDLLATALAVLIVVACWNATREGSPVRPSNAMIRLTLLAGVTAAMVTGDDPSRDRIIATAALVLAVVTRYVVAALVQHPAFANPVAAPIGGNDVLQAPVRSLTPRFRVVAFADGGAGSHAHAAP